MYILGVQYVCISIGKYLEVKSPSNRICICSALVETDKYFSKAVVPINTQFANNEWVFISSTLSPRSDTVFLCFDYSSEYVVLYLCDFYLHSLIIDEARYVFICSSAIWVNSLMNDNLNYMPVFILG